MKKIEAQTLEDAYAKAADHFACSVTDLEYEIIQHPTRGFLGIGAKPAIIVAACRSAQSSDAAPESQAPAQTSAPSAQPQTSTVPSHPTQPTHPAPDATQADPQPAAKPADTREPARTSETEILENFFDEHAAATPKSESDAPSDATPDTLSDQELSEKIEAQLGTLMRSTCFDIDTVEVDVIDGTAYIFVDGEDAALLIGKEGYRYNALSYLLYNWLHNQYNLYIKLEIAQFLASQQEMIRNYIQPVIEHVRQNGWGKTRPLDGILVQIALEQLREEFPDKYVAIKRTRSNERYILINEFNKRT